MRKIQNKSFDFIKIAIKRLRDFQILIGQFKIVFYKIVRVLSNAIYYTIRRNLSNCYALPNSTLLIR